MTKPLFSFALITRNEAVSLPNLLQSLEEFKARGGEVCVLDTGSTDDTVKIAEDWGCEVLEVGPMFVHVIDDEMARKINETFIIGGEELIVKGGDSYFSFGDARAYAMTLTATDWVCCPGADEVFKILDIDEINKRIEDQEFSQFRVDYIWSQDADGQPAVRLYRDAYLFDRRRWTFVGHIHETVVGVSGPNEPWANLPTDVVLVEHHQLPQTGRSNRDLVGLGVECLARPENDRNAHYLSRQLMFAGRYRSAVNQFMRHVKLGGGFDLERGQSMTFIGDSYKALGDLGKALEWYTTSFFFCSARREPLIRMAEIFYEKKDVQRSAAYAAAALTVPYIEFYANKLEMYGTRPHEILYWALYWLGDREGARYHWNKVIDLKPDHFLLTQGEFVGEFRYDATRLEKLIPGILTRKKVLYIGATPERQALVREFNLGGSTVDLVEIYQPYIDHFFSKGKGIFNQVIQGDILALDRAVGYGHYDVALWWHGPEHMDLADIPKALEQMEAHARTSIVAFPLEDHKCGEADPNPGNLHRSLPAEKMFTDLGWKTAVWGKAGDVPWPQVIAWKGEE